MKLMAVAAALATVLAQDASQRPTFRSRTDLVTVDVAVTRDGIPVPGLSVGDLELTDNGVRQRLELLDATTLPVDLTVVLDVSSSMSRATDGLKRDAAAIAGLLGPADRIRLMTFAADVRETAALGPASRDLALQDLSASGSTSLFDAVALAMMRGAGSSMSGERRHLIVVLTDGVDTSSTVGLHVLDDVSRRTEAALYAAVSAPLVPQLAPAFVPPDPSAPLIRRHAWEPPRAAARGDTAPLRVAVANTGGVWDTMRSIARAPEGVRRALDWFRAAYVVRYRATGVSPDGWHELRVRVTRPGDYDVKARKGYFAR